MRRPWKMTPVGGAGRARAFRSQDAALAAARAFVDRPPVDWETERDLFRLSARVYLSAAEGGEFGRCLEVHRGLPLPIEMEFRGGVWHEVSS